MQSRRLLVACIAVCTAIPPLGCYQKERPAPPHVPKEEPSTASRTIAHDILDLEFEGADHSSWTRKLDELLRRAQENFGQVRPGETESAIAVRFFHSVDGTLVDGDVIFPPSRLIDLLRNGLKPRHLPKGEYERALRLKENHRRRERMEATFAARRPFYLLDCDLSAIVYVAAGQRLGFPVHFVGVPLHNFVRWESASFRMNWDSNDAESYPDSTYARSYRVTDTGRELAEQLQNLSENAIKRYWLRTRSAWKERHHDCAGAVGDLRQAMGLSATDLVTQNQLAWTLATCEDDAVRDGKEAVLLAESVVKKWARANWLDTLAAAYAESRDFKMAVQAEEMAKQAARVNETGISLGDSLASFDECIDAYKNERTYVQGVREGSITRPEQKVGYDD